MTLLELRKVIAILSRALRGIRTNWNGKTAILEMKSGGSRHWKQMEWIGFYFELLCEKRLENVAIIPGPHYGRTGFDALKNIPWDFKAHATNTSAHSIIVNDSEAIRRAIRRYGHVGLILALGDVVYNDEKRSFQRWHQKIKGGKSRYEIARIKRGAWSRFRKVSFRLRQIAFIVLSPESLQKTGLFQSAFRNSNGSPRRGKVLIDLEKLKKEIIHKINF